MAFWQKI